MKVEKETLCYSVKSLKNVLCIKTAF